ncbi:MAG: hypothetical protein K0Q87_401 [Neobacillus sp.]|jgi:hypothetical protein|nr:hypothetical protein [Neobacillus sp.]
MKHKSKRNLGIAIILIGLAFIGYTAATKLPTFDTVPLSNAVSGTKSDYSALAVNTGELDKATEQLNLLMQKPEYENKDSIKAVLSEADSVINRIDIDDPLIQVENKEQAATALTEIQKSLDMAMTHYGVAKAQVLVERVDIGTGTIAGTVGDTLSITPYLYPTFAERGVLDWVSTDEAVATVTEDGDITMTGAGTATIILTETLSDVSASITVTVAAPVVAPPAPVQPKPQVPQATSQAPQTQQSGSTGSSGPIYGGEYTAEKEYDFTDNEYGAAELVTMTQEEIRDVINSSNGKWR